MAIRALLPDDQLNGLSLGHKDYAPLKTFLRKNAQNYEQRSLARTYVLVAAADAERAGRIWGYITLVASEVQTTHQNTPAGIHWPNGYHLPAIKLARMAVDEEARGKRYGEGLVAWALSLIADYVVPRVGCHLLITDAKRSAVGFYEKLGFTMLDTENNKARDAPVMFIHLSKVNS